LRRVFPSGRLTYQFGYMDSVKCGPEVRR
jgi:hypothetical protein